MLNKLYFLYSQCIEENTYINKIKRLFIKKIYNLLASGYYKDQRKKLSGKDSVIVSLTTFPDRIEKTWLVIESLIDQTIPPDKIVLTLSSKQFINGLADLPKELLSQLNRGLEIIWSEDDLRSHKKYYYVMNKYPKSKVITVDDDFFYSQGMVEHLLNANQQYPDAVICNLAAKKNGSSYKDWKNMLFEEVLPTTEIMQYGGSGVLYPPNSLHQDAFDKKKILNLCPLADDIWLNCMTIINNKKIVKTSYPYYLMPVYFKTTRALKDINVGEDMNSIQIKKLKEYYKDYE
ncbi:glycosyltransferase [Acinetobacter entericus]|uniref:Glycosyltransferase n=1 Tax=Acinetobacter entericus TaxID=2989714 RepID=A0ABT3NHS2_9GAMM|nr:glycosyltransferase [Acinetobacter entericus]MCW8039111.1 glycosyltransferase [Acinetobacter entericus]